MKNRKRKREKIADRGQTGPQLIRGEGGLTIEKAARVIVTKRTEKAIDQAEGKMKNQKIAQSQTTAHEALQEAETTKARTAASETRTHQKKTPSLIRMSTIRAT